MNKRNDPLRLQQILGTWACVSPLFFTDPGSDLRRKRMRMRYAVLAVLGGVWLVAAAAVSIAAASLVAESGWAELPVFAWVLLAVIFGVALPGLLFIGYKLLTSPTMS